MPSTNVEDSMEIPISLESDKCTGCSQCINVCPEKTLILEEQKVKIVGNKCMVCGHCQAACPTEAIKVKGIVIELGLQNIPENGGVSSPGEFDSATLVKLMRSRRSCRNFRSRGVDISLLEDLVKIGTTAPSGTNSQSWGFVILPTRSDIETFGEGVAGFYRRLNRQAANPIYRIISKIVPGDGLNRYFKRYYSSVQDALEAWHEKGEDSLFHGAVAAIVVMGEKSASCPAEDALLATQNILLAAHSMGLGSCLIGFAVEAVRRRKGLRKFLKMKEGTEVYSVIALGYPNEIFNHPAGRRAVTPQIIVTR